MDVWEKAIRKIPDPVVRELASRGRIRSFAKNSLIIREHDSGGALFVILSGRVKVYVSGAKGREMVLDHYGATDYVGEMALDGRPRSASVCALEPTVCSVVARAALRSAIGADPEIAMRMIATLIGRARSATGNVKSLALMDVYGRVARLLLSLEHVECDGVRLLRERLTQREIANRVGASRDMISRILKDLRTGGYIGMREQRIMILRRPPARW